MSHENLFQLMTSTKLNWGEKFRIKGEHDQNSFSGFELALWNILCIADSNNLANLALSFPEEVQAFLDWRTGKLEEKIDAILHVS